MNLHHNHDHYRRGYGRGGSSLLPLLVGVFATVVVGGYLLFGPEGRRNRRSLDRFIRRARFEILDKMEHMGTVTEEQYHKIVDEVMGAYGNLKEMGSGKLEEVTSRFKERWSEMREAAERARDEAEREIDEEEREMRRGEWGGGRTGSRSGQSNNSDARGRAGGVSMGGDVSTITTGGEDKGADRSSSTSSSV